MDNPKRSLMIYGLAGLCVLCAAFLAGRGTLTGEQFMTCVSTAFAAVGLAHMPPPDSPPRRALNAVPMPLWVAVTTNVVGKSGRRYPWILEFDGKYGHKNWLKNAISRVQAAAGGVLQRAVGEIEAKWRG